MVTVNNVECLHMGSGELLWLFCMSRRCPAEAVRPWHKTDRRTSCVWDRYCQVYYHFPSNCFWPIKGLQRWSSVNILFPQCCPTDKGDSDLMSWGNGFCFDVMLNERNKPSALILEIKGSIFYPWAHQVYTSLYLCKQLSRCSHWFHSNPDTCIMKSNTSYNK